MSLLGRGGRKASLGARARGHERGPTTGARAYYGKGDPNNAVGTCASGVRGRGDGVLGGCEKGRRKTREGGARKGGGSLSLSRDDACSSSSKRRRVEAACMGCMCVLLLSGKRALLLLKKEKNPIAGGGGALARAAAAPLSGRASPPYLLPSPLFFWSAAAACPATNKHLTPLRNPLFDTHNLITFIATGRSHFGRACGTTQLSRFRQLRPRPCSHQSLSPPPLCRAPPVKKRRRTRGWGRAPCLWGPGGHPRD